jgi:hypothetical protein
MEPRLLTVTLSEVVRIRCRDDKEEEEAVKANECSECHQRRAVYRYRGRYRARKDHEMCFECYRKFRNAMRLYGKAHGIWFPKTAKAVPTTTGANPIGDWNR